MILKGIEHGAFHKGVAKGLISLIPKEGNVQDLNYWHPITLLKVLTKCLLRPCNLGSNLCLMMSLARNKLVSSLSTSFLTI